MYGLAKRSRTSLRERFGVRRVERWARSRRTPRDGGSRPTRSSRHRVAHRLEPGEQRHRHRRPCARRSAGDLALAVGPNVRRHDDARIVAGEAEPRRAARRRPGWRTARRSRRREQPVAIAEHPARSARPRRVDGARHDAIDERVAELDAVVEPALESRAEPPAPRQLLRRSRSSIVAVVLDRARTAARRVRDAAS